MQLQYTKPQELLRNEREQKEFLRVFGFPSTEEYTTISLEKDYGFAILLKESGVLERGGQYEWKYYYGSFAFCYAYSLQNQSVEFVSVIYELDENLKPVKVVTNANLSAAVSRTVGLVGPISIRDLTDDCRLDFTVSPVDMPRFRNWGFSDESEGEE